MQFQDPPFELGTTLKGTQGSTLINTDKLGVVHHFQDTPVSTTPGAGSSILSGHHITAVALRNEAGYAILPGRLVMLTGTAGRSPITSVDRYSDTLLQGRVVLVDPNLPSAGCADDDIFWGIIGGPVLAKTAAAGAGFNGDIAAHAPLVAATGATSGDSAAGRVSNVTLAGQTAGTAAFSAARNIVGYALSAKTTGNTNADILVHMCINF